MKATGDKIPEQLVKLQVPAGQASPAPPVGPVLGQNGLNIQEFCTAFNQATKGLEAGLLVPVVLSVYKGRRFTFEIKSPPAAVLLRKAAGVEKGSGTPNSDKVGKTVTRAQLEEIARTKKDDLSAADTDAAVRTLAGTARSMGIEVAI